MSSATGCCGRRSSGWRRLAEPPPGGPPSAADAEDADADAGLARARFSATSLTLGRQRLVELIGGNTAFVLGTVVAINLLRIATSVVTTRLLDASAFGIIGILASVTFVLQMLADVGIFSFIVRHERGDDPRFLDEVWTLRVIRSVGLCLAMVAVAWPVALFTGQPLIGPVLAVASVNFLIEGASSLAFATAVRRGQVKRLNLMELIVMVCQVVLVIAFTAIFRSYWALVAAGAVTAIFKTVLTYAMFPGERRRWRPSRERMAELWGFSRFIASSSALSLVITQTDKLVFAQILPLSTFGLYSIATGLATAPTALAAPFCSSILYPGLARDVNEGADLRKSFYRRRRNVLLLYAFLVGGFIGSAPLLVEILYDPRYRDIAFFMQILSIATLMTMITATSSEVMIATQRAEWTFYSNIGRLAWLAAGVACAYGFARPVLLIWTVGLIEVPAMLVYWLGLQRVRAFSFIRELATPVAALLGLGIGTLGSAPILAWVIANS